MQEIVALLAEHADRVAQVRILARLPNGSTRKAGTTIRVSSVEDAAAAIRAQLEGMHEGVYKVTLEDGAGAYIASAAVHVPLEVEGALDRPSPAIEQALGLRPDSLDAMAVDSVIQAHRDGLQHNQARERDLDARFGALIELQLRTIELLGTQNTSLIQSLTASVEALANAKLDQAEAVAAAAAKGKSAESEDVFERTVDKAVDAWFTGKALDAGLPPELAGLVENRKLRSVLTSDRARRFLAQPDAADQLEQLLGMLDQPQPEEEP